VVERESVKREEREVWEAVRWAREVWEVESWDWSDWISS
jgi:hypothetical protein